MPSLITQIYLLSFTNVIQGAYLRNYAIPSDVQQTYVGRTSRESENLNLKLMRNKTNQSDNASAGMRNNY